MEWMLCCMHSVWCSLRVTCSSLPTSSMRATFICGTHSAYGLAVMSDILAWLMGKD